VVAFPLSEVDGVVQGRDVLVECALDVGSRSWLCGGLQLWEQPAVLECTADPSGWVVGFDLACGGDDGGDAVGREGGG
jgi:hypothetical protein